MPKAIISISVNPDQLQLLDRMALDDKRKRSGFIRHLVLQEARKRKLIDNSYEYENGRAE